MCDMIRIQKFLCSIINLYGPFVISYHRNSFHSNEARDRKWTIQSSIEYHGDYCANNYKFFVGEIKSFKVMKKPSVESLYFQT